MKKKTQKPEPGITIDNCQFYGVKWDIESLEVLKTVARGLTNLTELFRSQNVTINSLLSIGNPEVDVVGTKIKTSDGQVS